MHAARTANAVRSGQDYVLGQYRGTISAQPMWLRSRTAESQQKAAAKPNIYLLASIYLII